MSSPCSSSTDLSPISSPPSSVRSSTFLLASTTGFSEKFHSLPRSTTFPIASILSLGNFRRRAVYIVVLAALTGVLCANLLLGFPSSSSTHSSHADSLGRLIPFRPSNPPDHSLLAGPKPTVVALVSFNSRSRTQILDCYLQQNLVHNGGLVDRVILSPESSSEADLNWLRKIVAETDGYNLIRSSNEGRVEHYDGLEEKLVPLMDADQIGGSVGRSWKLAATLAQNMASLAKTDQAKPLFLFINSEITYLSPIAISSMIYTQQTRPEYSIIQANVVNQPILSWLHNKLGVVKPYRPQGSNVEPENTVFDSLRDFLDSGKHPSRSAQSWRASALPLWSHEANSAFPDIDSPTSPLLFGVPIDFQPPAHKYRWLPYDERQVTNSPSKSKQNTNLNFHQRPSLTTPVIQQVFSHTGPGKWPWTLSAQQLYSFLEHLEEEHDLTTSSGTNPTKPSPNRGRGLSRYRFPFYIPSPSPPLAPTLFLLPSNTLLQLLPSFPFTLPPTPTNETTSDLLRQQQANEEPTLAKWLASARVSSVLGGRGMVVDGNAVAARFLPGRASSESEEGTIDGEEDGRKGLEGTDLLERFWGICGRGSGV